MDAELEEHATVAVASRWPRFTMIWPAISAAPARTPPPWSSTVLQIHRRRREQSPCAGSAPPRLPELAFVAAPFAKSTDADLCFLCIQQELACSSRSTLHQSAARLGHTQPAQHISSTARRPGGLIWSAVFKSGNEKEKWGSGVQGEGENNGTRSGGPESS